MNQRTVFLDAVGLIALWNRHDQWHESAYEAYALLSDEKTPFITSSYVLLECGNAAARWTFRSDLMDLKARLERAQSIRHPTEDDWQNGWEAYQKRENGNAG